MEKETAFYLVVGILLASVIQIVIIVRSDIAELDKELDLFKQCLLFTNDPSKCL